MRVMVVCGFGLGSSTILRIKLDEVLSEKGISAETFTTDMTSAKGEKFDIVVTSKDLAGKFKEIPQPVIVIENFLSKPEIEEKALPVIQELVEKEAKKTKEAKKKPE